MIDADEIRAIEFAVQRVLVDTAAFWDSAAEIGAVSGTPSEATMALAEEGHYCSTCVRKWYRIFAEAVQNGAQTPDARIH